MKINKLEKFFIKKFGVTAGGTAIIKLAAIASIKVKKLNIPLSLLCIAPSRHYKSKIYTEGINKILTKNNSISELPSNITAHGLVEDVEKNKIQIKNKMLYHNDMNVTLCGRNKGLKATFLNSTSELLSEGSTGYSNKPSGGTHTISGRTALTANISSDAYNENRKLIYSTTFGNRVLRIYYAVPEEEQNELSINKNKR